MQADIEAPLSRGMCPIHVFAPADDPSAPVVLFFMDAFGPRPTLFKIAQRLAEQGYRVLLPHLFYPYLPFEPLDPVDSFNGGPDRQRLMDMFQSIDQPMIDADTSALLSFVQDRFGATPPIGCTGYCMGGRYALTAAANSEQVVFAAAFHSSKLALDTPDSPHHRLARSGLRIYIGAADPDPSFGGEEEGRLATALRDGGTDHVIETYAGAQHGFVMEDLPVYDPAAAERHWSRLADNLRETLLHR